MFENLKQFSASLERRFRESHPDAVQGDAPIPLPTTAAVQEPVPESKLITGLTMTNDGLVYTDKSGRPVRITHSRVEIAAFVHHGGVRGFRVAPNTGIEIEWLSRGRNYEGHVRHRVEIPRWMLATDSTARSAFRQLVPMELVDGDRHCSRLAEYLRSQI